MSFDLSAALAGVHERAAQVPDEAARTRALVLTHDNPDPDSLAAAAGLSRLLAQSGFTCTIGMGGIIGRAENRAMVRELCFDLHPVESLNFDDFAVVGLVDTQPGTGNNSLPKTRIPEIIVDHHPQRAPFANVPWCDIREELGASSTIVWSYLRERQVPWDPLLATAFLYAIKTETQDLGRDAGPAERQAYIELNALADHARLHRIANPKLNREHFIALDRACRNAICWGDLVAINLGTLRYPDLVAEIADLMLAYDRARWCICVGAHEGGVFLSVRSDVEDAHAGELIRRVVGSKGAAGGHGFSAGGRLHQRVRDEADLKGVYDELIARMVTELRISDPPSPLL